MHIRSLYPRLLAASLALAVLGCEEPLSGPTYPATETYAASLGVDIAAMMKPDTSLYYQDIVVGTGATASPGKIITVVYTGWLTDGTQFDSNVGKEQLTIPLTQQYLIPGWVFGIPGMKVGGKRKLVVGSLMGYGAPGSGLIPRHATLVFDIELKNVQ